MEKITLLAEIDLTQSTDFRSTAKDRSNSISTMPQVHLCPFLNYQNEGTKLRHCDGVNGSLRVIKGQ